jgi:hypothetical protein
MALIRFPGISRRRAQALLVLCSLLSLYWFFEFALSLERGAEHTSRLLAMSVVLYWSMVGLGFVMSIFFLLMALGALAALRSPDNGR